jgi:hypothetical protein
MTPEQAQRFLHDWPDWDRSIRAARRLLGYRPAWRPSRQPEDWGGWGRWEGAGRPGSRYAAWANGPGWALEKEARAAVRALRLPDQFGYYWRACFLSSYSRDALEHVMDWDRDGRLVRALPPLDDGVLTVEMDLTKSGGWLRIEGPLALATRETIMAAARRAVDMIVDYQEARIARPEKSLVNGPHPIVDPARRRARGTAARTERADRRARWIQARHAEGWSDYRVFREWPSDGSLGPKVTEKAIRDLRARKVGSTV